MKFTALPQKEQDSLRIQIARNRLQQLEAEYIQVEEAVEQCMMGDPTEEHTATQLKNLQHSKETIESVHKKYSARLQELEANQEALDSANSNGHLPEPSTSPT